MILYSQIPQDVTPMTIDWSHSASEQQQGSPKMQLLQSITL